MAYDRYDTRREQDRWRESDRGRSRGRGEERGFFERAGDEIASWFGDDDAERRGRTDERMNSERGWNREERGWGGNPDYQRDRDRFRGSRQDWDRGRWSGEDRSSARPINWPSSERDYRPGFGGSDRDFGTRGGGYDRDFSSRNDARYAGGGWGGAFTGSDYDRDAGSRGYDRSETPWGRDDYRRTSGAGASHHDRHYHAWRQRQLDDLDRDYDEYRRENQQRFESEFGTWRETRKQKRGLLGQIREHMEVVGSDGQEIGKVDKVRGDHVILTRSDSDDGRHHAIKCTMIDTVEGDQIRLTMPAEEAKSCWEDVEGRHEGDTNLERSFSGTYT
jgi:hypothetical protein